ncbi:MAG: 4-aminobutyrate--2-oxoglutarate transaminase, partial [Thermodesulfobacteriota bacterium]
RGALIYDVDGRELIDFSAGIAVMNIGHSHPKVVAAIKDQADRFTHTCWHVVMYESYVELADKLCGLAPGSFPKMAAFFNSGAEAVENAVKIARCHTGRPGLIAFEHAFHGRTYMALSLTSKEEPYKAGFGPFAPDVHRMPFAYCYRCPLGLEHPGCQAACADLVGEGLSRGRPDPGQIAALIVEPVPGEGGFLVPPPEYLPKLSLVCREHGILFIADEIQTGAGRTGRMFALEHFGVEPDLLTLAKSFAAGLPLSAVVGRSEIMEAPGAGALGGTFGGNPVSCRAALAVLEAMEEENLLARAETLGVKLRGRLEGWGREYGIIGDVRGLGPMMALELVRDPVTKEPADTETKALVRFCQEKGLLVLSCGTYGNVIRLLAPFVVGDEELERGLAILEEGLARLDRAGTVKAPSADAA